MASYAHLYSSYFKSEDFDKKGQVFTITAVKPEKVDRNSDKQKLVVYFEEDERGLVLNKTRRNDMIELFGSDDVDTWVDGKIKVHQGKTQFQGKTVATIVVAEAD